MTVQSEVSRVSYSGDGSTTAFSVNFYFLANADLRVVVRASDGTETLQTLGTDYSVTGAGNLNGGTVTFTTAPASGKTIAILRDPDITQLTDYNDQDPFPADSHEKALDKLTMISQRREEKLARAILLKETSSLSNLNYPDPEAGKLLRWNSAANGIENATLQETSTAFPAVANRYIRLNATSVPAVLTAQESSNLDELKDVNPGTTGLDVLAAATGTAARTAIGFSTVWYDNATQNVRTTTVAGAEVAGDAAPNSIEAAFYDDTREAGSGVHFKHAGTVNPNVPGQIQSPLGVFYTRSNKVLRPQQFGCRTGGDPATNRAGLLDLFSLANYTGNEIDMGSANDIYTVDNEISVTWTKKPVIRGSGAKIKLDRGALAESTYGLYFSVTNLGFDLEGFIVDGNFDTPNPLWIENQATTYVEANVYDARLVGVGGDRGYRSSSSSFAGRNLSVRGWFNHLFAQEIFSGENKRAAGSGVVGVTGNTGIFIGRDTNGAYPIYKDIVAPKIGKVWSEDPADTADMDGLLIFDALPASDLDRKRAYTNIVGGEFVGHYGRSIKLQASDVDISGARFVINGAPTGGRTLGCVDFQNGEGTIRGAQLFCDGAGPEHAVMGTSRSYVAGNIDVDSFRISGKGTVPTIKAIAYRYQDTSGLVSSLSVRGCSTQHVALDYIAKFFSRTTASNERASVIGNSVRSMASGGAGVLLEGTGTNTVSATFKDNLNLGGSNRPISATLNATGSVKGVAADNYFFT